MPRSRRRHHSRSRSRSHSHDRDREPKRRKIDNIESPTHKRSVSYETQSPTKSQNSPPKELANETRKNEQVQIGDTDLKNDVTDVKMEKNETLISEIGTKEGDENNTTRTDDEDMANQPLRLDDKLTITPKKTMSPRQLEKKLESEKRRKQKQEEREERERKKSEEKERIRLEKLKQKQERDEQKQKELEQKQKERELKEEQKQKEREQKEEQKRKEREEKEAKRKEKEEREEVKRKEREQEKLKKQLEIEEKNKEKLKQEEQKQKAAAAFANFFVTKKPTSNVEDKKREEEQILTFMPFQIKSDMRLPPIRRKELTNEEKENLLKYFTTVDEKVSYLNDLKSGKLVGRSPKTWPADDADDLLIIDDFGDSIYEDKIKPQKMRSKFLKFHENRRPAYFGTWRKTSDVIKPRRPLSLDNKFFDYEIDSDDDWEEEEQGESLKGSDDEDKDNETDDYEVDNEFFVPHGHLSDDEVDDEAMSKLSPESQKQKLKLLKDEFDEDMKMKTCKIKPRLIGCIWYNKDGSNVDKAIDHHLKPFAMITNGRIVIHKRSEYIKQSEKKELNPDLIPHFLKVIHGNMKKKKFVVEEFIEQMQNNDVVVDVYKRYLLKMLKEFAQWKKCLQKGPMLNKFCWIVEDDVQKKYNVALSFINK